MDLIQGNWIIAEIGSVHDGSFGNALKLIEAAAAAGANCVKFQTHIASAETLREAPSPRYFSSENRYDYFERTGFDRDQWRKIAEKAREVGVTFVSSPFSNEAVDLLAEIEVDGFKIASGEVTNLPMLEKIATVGRPVLLSSGMSTWDELARAREALSGVEQLGIFQCTSAYPCPPELVGLNNLDEIRQRFPGVGVGLSDHTLGFAAAISAAARGANIIEKHFTFSRLMYGSDAMNSMEPGEFKRFCDELRDAWAMAASEVDKDHFAREQMGSMKHTFEKSIVAACALAKGSTLGEGDLAYKKPGGGISASDWKGVIGKVLRRDKAADTMLSWEDFE